MHVYHSIQAHAKSDYVWVHHIPAPVSNELESSNPNYSRPNRGSSLRCGIKTSELRVQKFDSLVRCQENCSVKRASGLSNAQLRASVKHDKMHWFCVRVCCHRKILTWLLQMHTHFSLSLAEPHVSDRFDLTNSLLMFAKLLFIFKTYFTYPTFDLHTHIVWVLTQLITGLT